MKLKELKEIIKSSMVGGMEEAEIPTSSLAKVNAEVKNVSTMAKAILDFIEQVKEKETVDFESNAGMRAVLKKLNTLAKTGEQEPVAEAKKDEDEEEEDIDVDVEEEDVEEEDMDIEAEEEVEMTTPESKDDVQDSLEAALKAAKEMGDQKLIDQIGNTITFFTRTHVVKDTDSVEETNLNEENIGLADLEEMGYEAGEKAAYTYGTSVIRLQNRPDKLAYNKGFMQGVRDELGSSLDEGTEKNLNESYNRMQKLAGIIK